MCFRLILGCVRLIGSFYLLVGCVCLFLLTEATIVPKPLCVNGYFENNLRLINTGSTRRSTQDAPLPKVAFRRSEQRFRVQETAARIAPILLIVVHLATPAGIHALYNLVVGNAGLTTCDCDRLTNHRCSKSPCEIDAGVFHD
jgi:hypothetical protein